MTQGKGWRFTCAECGQSKPLQTEGRTGYATDDKKRQICYDCCGIRDRKRMMELGRITLYLSGPSHGSVQPSKVANWPGTLSFPVYYMRTSQHNIARHRYDVWFHGPDGHVWHGIQYGDNTQLCHCKRTKTKTQS